MSESRSRLVRVVAEGLDKHGWRVTECDGTEWCFCGASYESLAEHRAEVAVAAVLDELSEGPLHDAMVEEAGRRLSTAVFFRPRRAIYPADEVATVSLDAALSVARTWNEEE